MTATNTEDTFMKILKKCFLCTTHMVVFVAFINLQPYNSMLPVSKGLTKETDIGFMERGEHSPEDSSSSSIIIKGLQSLCLFVLIFNNSSLLYIEVNLFETWDFDYKCQAAFNSWSLNNSSIFSTKSEAFASKLLENY